MDKYNLIAVFNKNLTKILMCKRAKEPYKGMFNLVGGKIEKERDSLNEAYRELEEETGILRMAIDLVYFMDIKYIKLDKELEVYYGILNRDVKLVKEINSLEWITLDDNFFNIKKYAGEGNVGHIIEEIKKMLW